MLLKFDHFYKVRGENRKYLKPPRSQPLKKITCYLENNNVVLMQIPLLFFGAFKLMDILTPQPDSCPGSKKDMSIEKQT